MLTVWTKQRNHFVRDKTITQDHLVRMQITLQQSLVSWLWEQIYQLKFYRNLIQITVNVVVDCYLVLAVQTYRVFVFVLEQFYLFGAYWLIVVWKTIIYLALTFKRKLKIKLQTFQREGVLTVFCWFLQILAKISGRNINILLLYNHIILIFSYWLICLNRLVV